MKSLLRLFFISLIAGTGVIICSCHIANSGKNKSEEGRTDKNDGKESEENSDTSKGSNGTDNLGLKTVHLTVEGITCSSCKFNIESKLSEEPGIKSVEVFLNEKKKNVKVQYDPTRITLKKIKALVNEGKFTVVDVE